MARLLALLTTTALFVGGLAGGASAAPALSIRPVASTGGAVTLAGRALHAHGHTKITIQRRAGHHWRTAGSTRTHRSGAYHLTVHLPVHVTVVVRALVAIAGKVHISRALTFSLGASPVPMPSATPIPSPASDAATGAPARIPPAGTLESLDDVACPTDQLCWAVGRSSAQMPAVAELSGTTWRATALSMPAGAPTGELLAVACPTATFCAAAGETSDSLYAARPVLATWTAGTWTTSVVPAPPGLTNVVMDRIACGAADDCVALGQDLGPQANGPHTTVAARLTPAGWSVATLPTEPSSEHAISCPAAGACVAVTPHTIATLASGAWTTQPAAASDTLADVTCPAVGDCWAVGGTSDGTASGVAVHIQGTLTRTVVPSPATSTDPAVSASLASISCSSTTSCVAVGSYQDQDAPDGSIGQPFVALSSNGNWTVTSPQNNDAVASEYSRVVCAGVGACTAMGLAETADRHAYLQAADLAGEAWTPHSIRGPVSSWLPHTPLACPSAQRCLTVGADTDGITYSTPFVGIETDGTWAFSNPAGS